MALDRDRALPPPTGVRAVFLDMGDTLVSLASPLAGIYARAVAASGGVHDTDHLARSLAEVVAETDEQNHVLAFEASEEVDRLQWRDFNSRLLQRLEIAEHLWDATQEEIEQAFGDPANFTIYADAFPALERLRTAGYRLAVVSNWSWRLPELCDSLCLASHFDEIVASARVGYAKPHPGIFQHALALLDLPPEAVVHVGDNPIADVGGALRLGITPVLLDRAGENAGVDVPHRVASLHELVDLLAWWEGAR